MATLLLEGFDAIENPEDYFGPYHNVSFDSYFSIEETIVRTGNSLKCQEYDSIARLTIPFGVNLTTVYMGIAIRISGSPAAKRKVLAFQEGGTDQLLIYWDTDRTLVLQRTTTVLGTTAALDADTWYYLEIKAKIADSVTTDDVIIKLDGVESINLASGDTAATVRKYVDSVEIAGVGSSVIVYYDDMYVSDSENLGQVAIETIFPNANGNSSDFVGSDANSVDNYSHVGDAAVDEATYVDGGPGDKDTYGCSNVSAYGTIKALQVDTYLKKTGGGPLTMKPVVRISTTDYTGDEKGVPEDYGQVISQVWDTSPATAAAWTPTEINAAEFGVEVQT